MSNFCSRANHKEICRNTCPDIDKISIGPEFHSASSEKNYSYMQLCRHVINREEKQRSRPNLCYGCGGLQFKINCPFKIFNYITVKNRTLKLTLQCEKIKRNILEGFSQEKKSRRGSKRKFMYIKINNMNEELQLEQAVIWKK